MADLGSNWAGNYTYRAAGMHYPETIEQLQELVRNGIKIKALGSRHSFNDIADSPGDLISLERLPYEVVLDRERRTVTVSAGVKYGQICRQLAEEGFALHNMASLPHISVAGACATATHGSGVHNGNLATAVSAMELVTADGEKVLLSRDQHGEQFAGAVVGLGGLGVITKVTLDVVPAFDMRQNVYQNLPLAQLEKHFDEIVSSAYSVSLFTDWQNRRVNQIWVKQRIGDSTNTAVDLEALGATAATTHLHPLPYLSAEACTPQMGIVGQWYERLPHFRMGFTPSSGEELQTEYLVPRQHAMQAILILYSMSDIVGPELQVTEVRTIAADDLWMSPCYRQDCIGIHFTWKKNWPAVRQLLPLIEERLAPFEARPHWGKLFMMPAPQVQSLFARLPDFQQLLRSYDPQGKFRNEYLNTYIFGAN
ncbi:MAG: FAD-binding protein [Chloroflexota bacterium]